MVEDLKKRRILIGKTQQQVIDLLGMPNPNEPGEFDSLLDALLDKPPVTNNTSTRFEYYYQTPPERGTMRTGLPDNFHFCIEFDEAGLADAVTLSH